MHPTHQEHLVINTESTPRGALVLKLIGHLTLRTLFDFQEAARREASAPVIIDLAGVPYMDSAGLGAVISVFASCQRTKRGFAIIGVADRIHTLFQVTKVDGLLPCFPSLDDADVAVTQS
jgi:anti-sigma B factor antagonist